MATELRGTSLVASLTPSTYYLAVSRHDRDPVDATGATIWADQPFNVERAPDGTNPSGVLAGWSGLTAAGRYTINLTGTCFVEGGSGCPACAADYDQNGGVDGADIATFFTDFEQGASCADVDTNGGVDGADIGDFFVLFEAGGC